MRAQYSRGQPVRPAGGSRSTTEALARCLEGRGGRIRTSAPVDRIEVIRGRAVAVHAGGSRFTARQGIVSSIDPRRLFNGLLAEADVPPALRLEIDRIHSGIRNVAELKIDAVIDGELPPVSVPGFERSFMVSANTLTDLESAFAHISLGNLPERPPLTMAIRSALEAGWVPSGRNVLWVQTRIPWQPDSWSWDSSRLESAAKRPGKPPSAHSVTNSMSPSGVSRGHRNGSSE